MIFSQVVDTTYIQSSVQAFYFFDEVLLNGFSLDSNDWVFAYKDEECVGARLWDTSSCSNQICDIPAMGNDGTDGTDNYMNSSDVPSFKVFDHSNSAFLDMDIYNDYYPDSTINLAWSNFGFLSASELINSNYNFENASSFEYNSGITSVFIDDNYSMGEKDILVGYSDSQIRSIQKSQINGLSSGYIFISTIHLNQSINNLKFKYYNYESKLIFDVYQSFNIAPNEYMGDALNPTILSLSDIELSDNNFESKLVNQYSIIKAYPNPFNPSVNIELDLINNDNIEILIMDINGNQIDEIFKGYKLKGKYNFIWEGSGSPSGIYYIFVKNMRNTHDLVRKISLIK
tara:strand:- start:504 stop:1535 length:1032 start_codon:yes stop_codon:yes gene_type:complete